MYDGGELEWFGWFFDRGFMLWEEELRQIEMFAGLLTRLDDQEAS